MDFTTCEGRSEVVTAECGSGARLQAWSRTAFREEFLLHGDSKTQACRAASAGRLSVNGVVAPGRTLLSEGDVVTLRPESPAVAPAEEASANAPRKRRRMQLDPDSNPDSRGPLKNESFSAYYTAQRLCPPSLWPIDEQNLQLPLPCTVRLNRSFGRSDSHFNQEGCWLRCGSGSMLRGSEGRLLVEGCATGQLVQQELTSMLPVELLLGGQECNPKHVLDLCCAPGN